MAASFKLRNGFLLLSTEAPGGIYNSAQLKKIASLCDGESAIVKATEDQRLALLVQPAKAKQIATELKAVGLGIRNYQDGLHQPTNCIGALCPEHVQDAMTSAMDVTKELAKITLGTPLRIGINGCARCCVPTHTLDVSIIGDANGYRISLGGKNSQIPEMATFMAEGVPAAKLPKLIAKVVNVYKELAQAEESLQDVIERAGSKRFIEALAPYSQDAAASDDPFAGLSEGSEDSSGTVEVGDELSSDDAPSAPGIEDDFDTSIVANDKAPGFEAEDMDLGDASMGDDVVMDETLSDSDLGNVELGGSEAADAELADADLGDVALDDATLDDATLDDATLDDATLDDATPGDVSLDDGALDGGALDGGTPEDELLPDGALDDGTPHDTTMSDAALNDGGALEDASIGDEVVFDESLATIDAAAITQPDGLDSFDDDAPSQDLGDIALNETLSADAARGDALESMSEGGESTQEFAAEEFAEEEFAAEEFAAEEFANDVAGDAAVAAAESLSDVDFESMKDDGAAAIQAAPVAAKPAAAQAPAAAALAESDDDTLLAEEVGEDEADAFEQKLNASIAEEETLPVEEDVNVGHRLEAMRLVEATESVDAGSHNFDDLQIEDEDHALAEAGLDEIDAEPETFDEDVAPVAAVKSVATAPRAVEYRSSAAMDFVGMDFTGDGRVSLRFANGAQITLDPRTVPAGSGRELSMAGKRIVIAPSGEGLSVEVDGVGIFVPRQAA